MRVLGVDPGGTGALALVQGPFLLELADMPILHVSRGRKGKKKEVNVHALADLIADWRPDVCYFERVHGMDGDSASTAFNFGRAAGAAEACIKLGGGRFIFVTPPSWKRAMKLIGTSKDDSRALAINLWPAKAKEFSLKKHDGRADASLIAEYGRKQLMQEGIFG